MAGFYMYYSLCMPIYIYKHTAYACVCVLMCVYYSNYVTTCIMSSICDS